ncbi:MAG TPA: transglycosylase domain-containing protein [Actinomycetota bacterium]|nr:transglycosylase domain-containing protein [Actinomycetota bacterium]
MPRTKKATRRARPKPGSRAQRWLLRYGWILPLAAVLVGGGILGLTYAFARIPLPEDIDLASSAEVYDAKGRLIGTYSDEVRRFLIDTRKLPDFIGDAVIAAEDRDYYDHSGVSVRGIMRAGWANLTGGEVAQGGSTITQQYVKNAVLEDFERTVTRKVKEAVLAIKLERRHSKEEILGFYLNTIYLGRGAYGFEAAARSYFGYEADKEKGVTSAEQLTLGQAAYLAGIIPSPESYQPDEQSEAAAARRDRVLDLMVAEGYITSAEADEAKEEKLKVAKGAQGSVVKRQTAAYYMEWLRRDFLSPEYGRDLFTGGLKIYTTLDLDMQAAAEDAVSSILTEKTDPEAAVVSLTPKGEVRALVGGRDFTNVKKARGFDFATDFPGRQAGSAFKPFTLLTAIEEDISPQSTFSGASPQIISDPECADPDGTPWEVENFEGGSYGSIDLVQATTSSVNTVYAQLAAELGPEKIANLLEDFELHRPRTDATRDLNGPEYEVCSLSLGTLDVTPMEMARSYAAFAGRGALPDVMPIRFIEDSQGNCLKSYRSDKGAQECSDSEKVSTEQVVDENSADVLNQTLTNVVTSGTATAADIGRPVAGKTGTTQNHANAWFAGHVPQLATVVWMGYPIEERKVPCEAEDESVIGESKCKRGMKVQAYVPLMEYCTDTELCRPVHGIEVTGGSFPAQIWAAYMRVAVENMEVLSFPVPVDQPDEIINPRPSFSAAPRATTSAEPEPDESQEPTPEPTEDEPEPTPEPTDDEPPNPLPSGTQGGDRGG